MTGLKKPLKEKRFHESSFDFHKISTKWSLVKIQGTSQTIGNGSLEEMIKQRDEILKNFPHSVLEIRSR